MIHRREKMETQKIIWFDLSDSQKAEVLKRARTYMIEQKTEARIATHRMAVFIARALLVFSKGLR